MGGRFNPPPRPHSGLGGGGDPPPPPPFAPASWSEAPICGQYPHAYAVAWPAPHQFPQHQPMGTRPLGFCGRKSTLLIFSANPTVGAYPLNLTSSRCWVDQPSKITSNGLRPKFPARFPPIFLSPFSHGPPPDHRPAHTRWGAVWGAPSRARPASLPPSPSTTAPPIPRPCPRRWACPEPPHGIAARGGLDFSATSTLADVNRSVLFD